MAQIEEKAIYEDVEKEENRTKKKEIFGIHYLACYFIEKSIVIITRSHLFSSNHRLKVDIIIVCKVSLPLTSLVMGYNLFKM